MEEEGLLIEKGRSDCQHRFIKTTLEWNTIGEYRKHFDLIFRECSFCGRKELISGILTIKSFKTKKVLDGVEISSERIGNIMRGDLKHNREEILEIYSMFGFNPAERYYEKMLRERTIVAY